MIHTVRSGDTLSRIASAHQVTLAQLLDANPRLKPNPNRIRVGESLVVPRISSAGSPPSPAEARPRPQPTAAGLMLGRLSEQFETGGRGAGTVSTGVGDAGGVSYGSYQMTSKPGGGRVKQFVSGPDFPFREKFTGLTPGTSAFSAVWKKLADSDPEEFQRAQHDFIKRTHFDPLVRRILLEDGLDVLTRSHALQDAVWSTAVQHGPGCNIVKRALRAVDVPPEHAEFDRRLITAIYAERGRRDADGALVHFRRNAPAVQSGVARRFEDEQSKALAMLEKELAG